MAGPGKLAAAALKPLAVGRFSRGLVRSACRVGLIPHSVYMRWPAEGTVSLGYPGIRPLLYRATVGDRVGREVYWAGLRGFEPETTRLLPGLLPSGQGVFFDVGAYTGLYTLLACSVRPGLRAVAVEPITETFDKLTRSIRDNQLAGRVSLHNAALAEAEGAAEIFLTEATAKSDKRTGASLLTPRQTKHPWTQRPVRTLTLDSLTESHGPPDLIKIDVEGAEHKVLLGARKTLEQARPALIIECNPGGPYREVQSILSEFGYRAHHVGRRGPIRRDTIVPDPREVYRNWLFTVRDLA